MTVAELAKSTLLGYPRNVNFGSLYLLGNVADFLTIARQNSGAASGKGNEISGDSWGTQTDSWVKSG
jgi:hypothetical protein